MGASRDLILSSHSFEQGDRSQNAPSESALSVTSRVRQVTLEGPCRMSKKRILDSSPDNNEQKTIKKNSRGGTSRSNSRPVLSLTKEDVTSPQRIAASRPAQITSYPPSRPKSSLSQSSDVKNEPSMEHRSSSISSRSEPEEEGIQLQPETRPITQEQLVNEVKGMLYLISSHTRLCKSKLSSPDTWYWFGMLSCRISPFFLTPLFFWLPVCHTLILTLT